MKLSNGIIDFSAGTAGGVLCTFVEHPFDTVKVVLQADDKKMYRGCWSCARSLCSSHGIRAGLYAGVTPRLCIASVEHAIIFAVYGWHLRLLGTAPGASPKTSQVLLAGAGTGVWSAMFLTPFELMKCRMQSINDHPIAGLGNRSGSVTMRMVGQHVIQQKGITGLFTGLSATLMREIPGNAVWLGTYETIKGVFQTYNERHRVPSHPSSNASSLLQLTAVQSMLAGGVSGVMFWTVFFPADVVKTRMQVLSSANTAAHPLPSFGSMLQVLYREGGVRRLYAGWWITALRSFPSNAALFSTYEVVRNGLHRWGGHPREADTQAC